MQLLKSFLPGVFVLAIVAVAAGQKNSRAIDFKNFRYPWGGSSGWNDHLVWLDASKTKRIQLVDGKWPRKSARPADDIKPFSGLSLESVKFGDLGDHKAAIVVLRYDTGGTQYSHYVYIYDVTEPQPKFLGYFHSGDRAYSGLYKVYTQNGALVVELFDPQKREGDCCSSGFTRTHYRWQQGAFNQIGRKEFGSTETESRVPVSVSGAHDN